MKARQVNYNDLDQIQDITVTMSFKEAVALVNIAGQLNGKAARKLNLGGNDSLYDCLVGVFNNHYEDGCPSLGIDIGTLNE